jgi:hypothetical protein
VAIDGKTLRRSFDCDRAQDSGASLIAVSILVLQAKGLSPT